MGLQRVWYNWATELNWTEREPRLHSIPRPNVFLYSSDLWEAKGCTWLVPFKWAEACPLASGQKGTSAAESTGPALPQTANPWLVLPPFPGPLSSKHPECFFALSVSFQPQAPMISLTSHRPPAFTVLWFEPRSTASWTFLSPVSGLSLPLPFLPQVLWPEALNLDFLLEVSEERLKYISAWVLLQTKRLSISKDEARALISMATRFENH